MNYGWPLARQESLQISAMLLPRATILAYVDRSHSTGDDPSDLGDDAVPVVVRGARLGIIRRRNDRRAIRRPDDRNVVGVAVHAAAGLVAYAPRRGQAG